MAEQTQKPSEEKKVSSKVNVKDFTPLGKMKYKDKVQIEMTQDYVHMKKGAKYTVHSTHANAYIKGGVAKLVKGK